MMLAFRCPLCGDSWPVSDGEPGRVARCRRCARSVLLPPWAPPRAAETPPLPRESSSVGAPILAVAAALLVVAAVGGSAWLALRGQPDSTEKTTPEIVSSASTPAPAPVTPARAAPTGPPEETWTLDQVVDHWRQRRTIVGARPTDYGSLLGPALFVSERGDVTEDQAASLTKSTLPAGFAFVQRRKTAAEARAAAAGTTRGAARTWGRFYLVGDAALVERLCKSLP